MATKAKTAKTNELNASVAAYAVEAAKLLAANVDVWPNTFAAVVEWAQNGDMTDTDANKDDKTAPTIDDDVNRLVNLMNGSGEYGVAISEKTAKGRKSGLRAAVELGIAKKNGGPINGISFLADVRKAWADIPEKRQRPMFETYYKATVAQNKTPKARLTHDGIKDVIQTKLAGDPTAATKWEAAAKLLDAIYTDEETKFPDTIAGHELREELARAVRKMADKIKKEQKKLDDAEIEASEAEADEKEEARIVTLLKAKKPAKA